VVGRKRDSNRRSHSRKGRCREVGTGIRENRCPPCGDREFEFFSSASGSVSAGQIFALQAKGWLSSLVGLLTVGAGRPARNRLDDIRVAFSDDL